MSNRTKTRDLLLNCCPVDPHAVEIKYVYPWENYDLGNLIGRLYSIASKSGFNGTFEEFKENFGSYLNKQEIVFDVYNHFPQVGDADHLYFDLGEKILYHWDNGYIPVNAMLIADTIVTGGGANGL